MPSRAITEEPLQFGQGGRLFGILSEPAEEKVDGATRPAFVFLSAGLLHRPGPSRLHVLLARGLAAMGFASLRVDLSGKGDSPARDSMTNRESVAMDFADICTTLEGRYGSRSMVLAGLCSGADNAVRLCETEPGVVGLLLFDPICIPDEGFKRRAFASKYTNAHRYLALMNRLFRTSGESTSGRLNDTKNDPLMLRDLPTIEQMRRSFELVGERGGAVLSIFTQYALGYYNAPGQLETVLQMDNYRKFCLERFWPDVEHTYKLEIHRERLFEEVMAWARNF